MSRPLHLPISRTCTCAGGRVWGWPLAPKALLGLRQLVSQAQGVHLRAVVDLIDGGPGGTSAGPHRGDGRPRQYGTCRGEHAAALQWLRTLGPPGPRDRRARQPRHLRAPAGATRAPCVGSDYMRAECRRAPVQRGREARVSRSCAVSARIALVGVNSAVPTPPVHCRAGASAATQLQRLGRSARCAGTRAAHAHRAHPLSAAAGTSALAVAQAPGCRGDAAGAGGARRRAGSARAQPHQHAGSLRIARRGRAGDRALRRHRSGGATRTSRWAVTTCVRITIDDAGHRTRSSAGAGPGRARTGRWSSWNAAGSTRRTRSGLRKSQAASEEMSVSDPAACAYNRRAPRSSAPSFAGLFRCRRRSTLTHSAQCAPIWLTVVSAGAIVGISMGLRQVMGLFLPPMTKRPGHQPRSVRAGDRAAPTWFGAWARRWPVPISDKFGAGRVIVAGALATMLGLYLMQAATSEWMLLVSGVLLGVGISGAGITSLVGVVGRNAPAERRTAPLPPSASAAASAC